MRATTAFNKMLAIPGASVTAVAFTGEGLVVDVRQRRRRPRCPCGRPASGIYDRSQRRWRHLDLGATKLWLQAEICRVECRGCGRVRTEEVSWARPGARLTRDFEDVVAWLAQRTDKTTITKLLRTTWETVAAIVQRVVADHLDHRRLNDVFRIGVDEISYRTHHRYLTVIADHDRDGAVIWAGEGRNAAAMDAFYETLGPDRCTQLQAVSMDFGRAYQVATDRHAPQAAQCVDPFHVIALANRAIDRTRLDAWKLERANNPPPKRPPGRPPADAPPTPTRPRWIKNTRWALVKDPDNLTDTQHATLRELYRQRSVLYRAWQLKEALRDLYRLTDPTHAADHLDWWLAWACRSRIPAFLTLSRTIRTNRHRVLNAVTLGLSNSKLEGLNSKIRLINHRGYGHHSATAIIAMIYLCAGGITINLPLT